MNRNKNILVLILCIVAVVIGIFVLLKVQSVSKVEVIDIKQDETEENAEEEKVLITVDISGEVKKPGVYEFEEGMIINDAIEKAGGLTDQADTVFVEKNINRAQKLTDQQKIYIPAKSSKIAGTSSDNSTNTKEGKININTCSVEELESLPGIGPSYAEKIMSGRPYSKIEDIKNVKGIGESTYNKIKDLITV